MLFRSVQFDTSVGGTGALVIQPLQDDFVGSLSLSDFTFGTSLSGLTIGKAATSADGTSDQDVTLDAVIDINGPVTVYGGDIAINQNIDTTGGAASGDVLMKSSGDISLASSKSITTTGGDVILWANTDGQTSLGSVLLRDQSTVSTSGGNIWIGGSASGGGSTNWNGLTVGDGYAVSGLSITPVAGGEIGRAHV